MSDNKQPLKEKDLSLPGNELERFRQDWLSEVNQKTSQTTNKPKYTTDSDSPKIQEQIESTSNNLEESQETLSSLELSNLSIKNISDRQRHQVALELYKEAVSDEKKGKLGEGLNRTYFLFNGAKPLANIDAHLSWIQMLTSPIEHTAGI